MRGIFGIWKKVAPKFRATHFLIKLLHLNIFCHQLQQQQSTIARATRMIQVQLSSKRWQRQLLFIIVPPRRCHSAVFVPLSNILWMMKKIVTPSVQSTRRGRTSSRSGFHCELASPPSYGTPPKPNRIFGIAFWRQNARWIAFCENSE